MRFAPRMKWRATAAGGLDKMFRAVIAVILGVLLIFCLQQDALAQTKKVRDAVDIIVMFCVAGGAKFEVSSTGSGNGGLDLKKEGGANIQMSKSEARGLVDGIQNKMDKLTAEQASEARRCMQPYIARIVNLVLESDSVAPPAPLQQPAPIPQQASLPSRSNWNHNTSLMSITADGGRLEIYYDRPRKGMMDEGVRKGTLLFTGSLATSKVTGTAYVFDRNCNAGIPYRVAGDVMSDTRKIILSGQAPSQLDGCRPVAYRPDTLVFER